MHQIISHKKENWSIVGDAQACHAGVGGNPFQMQGFIGFLPTIDFDVDGSTTYVRVFNTRPQSKPYGEWMMKSDDIKGLTPEQIQDKFDLPNTPTHVTNVRPTQGTQIRTGTTNFGGNGGGTQFQLLDDIPDSSFFNRRSL